MPRNVPGELYTRISNQEADEMMKAGDSVIIDVRDEGEYQGGHVKGATWMPWTEVIERFDELPAEGNLLFICEIGARSGVAAESAAAMGANVDRLFNVEEGTSTWINHGLPYSTGDEK
jgi:rhodanese-related sulfurtransferase